MPPNEPTGFVVDDDPGIATGLDVTRLTGVRNLADNCDLRRI